MAAGLPVVATPMGGVPELIGQERCVPGDADALASRLRELWEDADLRDAEGQELTARARGAHSEERFTAELLALYERLAT
jgi:glycosyltransferase involved in cell wall biosynthesis